MAEHKTRISDPDKIVKEVWSINDIEAKTELNPKQIENVNKSLTLANLFGSELLNAHINNFLVLQKSKDRKSMGEFVESLRSKKNEILEKAKNLSLMG